MSVNLAVATTLEDCLAQLGGVAAERVRMTPPPGQATFADCIAANEAGERGLYELVDGTLVEKATSCEASAVAATVARILGMSVRQCRLGLISGADGFFQLMSSTRGPDVAFVSRDRLPGGVFPTQPYPALAPNLVVEVLSPGITKAEMTRKRLEYFHSGVELLWNVDCVHRSVAVYTSPSDVVVFGEEETIDGGELLPGFKSPVADFFTDLDIGVTTRVVHQLTAESGPVTFKLWPRIFLQKTKSSSPTRWLKERMKAGKKRWTPVLNCFERTTNSLPASPKVVDNWM